MNISGKMNRIKCQNAEGSLSLAVKSHVIRHNEAGESQHNACKALDFVGLAVWSILRNKDLIKDCGTTATTFKCFKMKQCSVYF